MQNITKSPCSPVVINRRQALARWAGVCGTLLLGFKAGAEAPPADGPGPSGGKAKEKRTALHYTVSFNTTSERVYTLLQSAPQFLALTGNPAQIDPVEGGAFSLFGGLIVGRNIELVPNVRIVQAWRPTHWDAGLYSIVEFQLAKSGKQTTVVLDHIGFPPDEAEHLDAGWKAHYLDPMAKYFRA